MQRIWMVIVGAALAAAFAAPASAQTGLPQTNQMCMLRCLDHGRLYQQCHAVCTPASLSGAVAPAHPVASQPPVPGSRAAIPAHAPVPGAAASSAPAANPPAPAMAAAPGGAATAAPPGIAPALAQTRLPQTNQMCLLHCLDHGRLYEQCQAVCTPPPDAAAPAPPH